jgi:acyl-CoA synthetase (AMP-forming)/AMP-acid ligase II
MPHDTSRSGTFAPGEAQADGYPKSTASRSLGKMVVGSILTTTARRFPDREAFLCAGTRRRFTFQQTNERCNRLAHALLGLGLRKPDVVAFLCNNRAEMVEIYFALAKTGLVGIPLNYRLAVPEVVELMRAMHASALLYSDRFTAAATAVRNTLPEVRHFVAVGDEASALGHRYEALLLTAAAGEPEGEVEEHDRYYFNLTSGTTGVPKSYLLTHYNNAAMSPNFEVFEPSRRDVILTAFPAFGRIGFGWMATSVGYGARNVLLDFTPAEALRIIEAERVTLVNLAPTMAAMMLAEPSLPTRDLRSLRTIIFAGAALPAPLRERVAAAMCPRISEYYGMQETGVLTASTPEERVRRPDSVGLPTCFAEVRIELPDGRQAAPGELGEILGRSPNTTTSYFDNPGKTAETFRGGWVHTGDLGFMDEEGFLYIRGRLKDLIITGGQNVHAAEVEEAILRLPGVAECAVFGLPDELWGERVAAVVVTQGTEVPSAEVIEAACREHLAGFKMPRTMFLQEEPLPRTPTGKVQKFVLVQRHGEQQHR